MKIQTKKTADAEYILLQGELDFHAAADLRKELTKITEKKSPKVMIDFKKVSYIDSSGLAAFVEFFQMGKETGMKMAFYNLSDEVKHVFEISKLNSVFSIASDEKQALAIINR